MKKIVCLILCLLFSGMTLCACNSTYENSIIKHNYQRDYSQAIVTIDPITESGKREDGSEWSYKSDEIKIFKSQLVSYINNYGSIYVNSYGMDYNEMVDYFIEQLILTELVIIEADVRLEKHDIFWSREDIDSIQKSVYSAIDSELEAIYDEILEKSGSEALGNATEHDHDAAGDHDHDDGETTYPVKPEDEVETEREFFTYGEGKKHDDWYFDGDLWFTNAPENFYSLPGNYGNADTKSLAREGVKRLISQLEKSANNLINLTNDEKTQIKNEVAELKKAIEEKGVAYAYKDLGKTLMVKKLYADSYIMTQKMTLLQNFIEDGVTISEQEIVDKYNKMLADQMSNYSTGTNYDSAATGTNLILYRPNDNYVYVKHILIPFSDEQTAYLRRYKETNSEEDYLAERKRMVNNIVAYEHVNGEDDTSRPLTVSQIWSDIKSTMARASANAYDAERTFNDLIYKYNTDPGIFNNEYGYAVKYKLATGESETYMSEFAETARAFRNEGYKVGQVYDEYILTDYGVHVMYYAADYKGGEILTLNSYTTPGRYTLVRDKIEEDLLSDATNAAYSVWQDERIYYYRNTKNIVNMIEKAYKDLYEENHNHNH